MFTEKHPTQKTMLDEAQVYTQLGWRWSLWNVPMLTLSLGFIPSAGYAMLVVLSARAAQSGAKGVGLLVACIAAVVWQAPELLIQRGRRRPHPAVWVLGLGLVLLFGFTVAWGRGLPWEPIFPLALAGGLGVFALEYKQTHPITPSLLRYVLGPRVLSPFIGSMARRPSMALKDMP